MMAKTKNPASELKGPEWDSSDEEPDVNKETLEKTTTKTRNKSKKTKKKNNIQKTQEETSNVVYIGHLPKDCQERELIAFLKQFGELLQLRLCRSHRTGGTKGYAFARFQSQEVAAIVAETMNGQMLFQKRLVCHVVPPDRVHSKLFSSKTRTIFQRPMSQPSRPQSLEKMKQTTKNLRSKERKKREALKAMGIDYDFPGYEALVKESDVTEPANEVDDESEISKGKGITKSSSRKKKRKTSEDATEMASPKPSKMEIDEEEPASKPQSEKKHKKEKKEKKKRRKTT